MTLAMLQAFGHPSEVAARYHRGWNIIDPRDTRPFLVSAIIGGALLVAASVPSALLTPETHQGPDVFLPWWLGVLLTFFGIKSWLARRHPRPGIWRPRKTSRLGLIALVPLIGLGIMAYGAPQWLFAKLSGGQQLAPWLDYDPTFRAARLPWLLTLWGCHGVLMLVTAIQGDWTRTTRRLNLALGVGTVVVLTWFTQAGRIFVESTPNQTAHAFLWAFILVLLIDIGFKIHREKAWVRMPDLSTPRVHAG